MQHESFSAATWRALSNEWASTIERMGRAVVAVHGRRRIPSSGVQWRRGIVVTADHTLQRDEEITVTLPEGRNLPAILAGRDPSTDLALLKVEGLDLPAPDIGETKAVKVGHWILAAGRTSEGGTRASLAMVGVAGPAWQTWRGGLMDQTIRLDRNLHPNLSGGPAVDDQGRVLGINTSGLSRFAAVVVPASTVERVSAELERKGRIGRGYLGVGMHPVRLPRKLRESLKLENEAGIIIVGVEPESPAENAGMLLGDIVVALHGKRAEDLDDVRAYLAGEYIGKPVKASIVRGGTLLETVITVGERPAR